MKPTTRELMSRLREMYAEWPRKKFPAARKMFADTLREQRNCDRQEVVESIVGIRRAEEYRAAS